MGWICKHCGTENEMSSRSCIACSTAAEAAYLQSEARAAERERRQYLRRIARKLNALMQDYRHLRRALMCLNALAVLLVIACAAYTALQPDLIVPENAALVFSSDAVQHPGIARALSQADTLARRAERALPELDGQWHTLQQRLNGLRLPFTPAQAAQRLTRASDSLSALADEHLAALQSSGELLLSRTQSAGEWLESLRDIFAPNDNTKERQSE